MRRALLAALAVSCAGRASPPPARLELDRWLGLGGARGERTGAHGATGAVARQAVAHLMGWRDVHLAVTAEAGDLVVAVSGDRR